MVKGASVPDQALAVPATSLRVDGPTGFVPSRLGRISGISSAQIFLTEAARYFENRPIKGEDRAYWANVYNAENCREVAALLAALDRAVRLRVWNECKAQGLRDDDAYSRIQSAIAAIATEARRAATVEQGAVHEGAGPKDIAQ